MSRRYSVLLIDDDAVFSASVVALLESSRRYRVVTASTAREGEEAILGADVQFDAVLLDVTLPDENGIDLCVRLRSNDLAIPIILVTGSEDEALLVRGLHAGADDFVRKPFRATELLARLESRIRTFASSRDAAIPIGRYVFHPGKRMLFDPERNGRIPLADKEARLLWHLYHGNGDVVSRLSLLHAIWGYSRTATTHTVETHIYRLRQKIESDPARPTMVITERGGYRFAMNGQEQPEAAMFRARLQPRAVASNGRL